MDFKEPEREVIELPATEDDPYGIFGECAKYDICLPVPHYLPEGFILTNTSHNDNDNTEVVTFNYYSGKKSVSLVYVGTEIKSGK